MTASKNFYLELEFGSGLRLWGRPFPEEEKRVHLLLPFHFVLPAFCSGKQHLQR
jgi:hypothetical protein